MSMKRLIILTCTLLMAAACGHKPAVNLQQAEDEINAQLQAVIENANLSDQQKEDAIIGIFKRSYYLHKEDSLAVECFENWLVQSEDCSEALAEFPKSPEIVRNNENIAYYVSVLSQAANTSLGKMYIDFKGIDVATGKEVSLSDYIGKGDNPTIVDFWASWCNPCRQEIKDHVIAKAEKGEVNVVGVAVWEESIEDTKAAIEELGINYPVIYAGGRENSPSQVYGFISIPELLLLSTDGIVLGRGKSVHSLYFNKESLANGLVDMNGNF